MDQQDLKEYKFYAGSFFPPNKENKIIAEFYGLSRAADVAKKIVNSHPILEIVFENGTSTKDVDILRGFHRIPSKLGLRCEDFNLTLDNIIEVDAYTKYVTGESLDHYYKAYAILKVTNGSVPERLHAVLEDYAKGCEPTSK